MEPARRTVLFHDASCPQATSLDTLSKLLPGPFDPVDAAGLAATLDAGRCGLLVSFHRPYFPKTAWPSIRP
jgi:hypothetical protein